jgi:alcohol dehydrogenase
MRAALYAEYGGPLPVVDVPDPRRPDGGAVIRVEATGVCRSDWHSWRGHEPVVLPHIGGHEYAGVVVEIDPAVAGFHVGDRVTVPFVCGCGRCEYCLAGQAQVCPNQTQPGFSGPGSFAELVAVPGAATNLVRLPEGIEATAAASLGCRFATAYRAVTAHGRLTAGQWLAVHGCGGVGLSAVMIGVALGARVVAVDVSAAALARAAQLGAEAQVDASPGGDLGKAVRELTGGGAHVSIDALGSPSTAANSVRSLRRRGRHVQVGLLLGDDARAPLPMARVIAWELEIYGSHGMAATDYPSMLALVAGGSLRPQDLIGRTIGLDGVGDALAAMDPPVAPATVPAGGSPPGGSAAVGAATGITVAVL